MPALQDFSAQSLAASLTECMEYLEQMEGRLFIWGLYPRLLGIFLFISMASLAWQLVPLAGEFGLSPARKLLSAYKRDFGVRAYWFWPTLLWLNCSDMALRLVPAVGALAGLAAASGWHSQLSFAVSWACLLSVDQGASGLVYPWDSFLLENAFLALFLPALPAVQSTLSASALPSPLAAWWYRWLVFRLLVGFGKLKFQGSGWRDRLYIKSFLLAQPMINQLGFLSYWLLPRAAFAFLLLFMWLAEIPLPLLQLLFSGWIRALAGGSIVLLMLGIQAVGNFGYFNGLTAVAALTSLDHTSVLTWDWRADAGWAAGTAAGDALAAAGASVQQSLGAASGADWAGAAASVWALLAGHWRALLFPPLLLLFLLPASLLQFIMNSWINLAWPYWSGIYRLRLPLLLRWSQWYAGALRGVLQWRMVQAYGVFPPTVTPAQRWAVLFEGSDDNVTWKRYEYNYYLSGPRTAPAFIAPWHPRLDHAIFYETFYNNGCSPSSILGNASPYSFFSSTTPWVRLQQRLLEGGASAQCVSYFWSVNPYPDPARPPKYVRVMVAQYNAAPLSHVIATGEYWHETVMGVHQPAMSLEALAQQSALTVPPPAPAPAPAAAEPLWPAADATPMGPEDFFVEHLFWRRRAGQTAGVVTAADYEAVWRFLQDLRTAAVAAAAEGAAEGASTATDADGGASHAAAAAAAAAQTPLAAGEIVAIDVFERTHFRAPIDAAEVHAAVGTLHPVLAKDAASSAASALPLAASHEVLVWSFAPAAYAAIRRKYTAADLVAVRRSISRLCMPLLLAIERLCDRIPSQEVTAILTKEVEAALVAVRQNGEGGVVGLARLLTSNNSQVAINSLLDVLVAAPAPDCTLPSRSGSSSSSRAGGAHAAATTHDGYPIYEFAGNDDGMHAAGGMRNPMRWIAHCYYLLFVGGRQEYERAVAHVLAGEHVARSLADAAAVVAARLLNQRLPTTCAHPAASAIAAAPLSDLLLALTVRLPDGRVVIPGTAPTEASTYLLLTLTYQAWATSAIAYHRLQAQSRPSKKRSTAVEDRAPAFLPSFLELVPRILAHPQLRRLHDDCGLHRSHGSHGSGAFLPAPLVPRWKHTADESDWVYAGIHAVSAQGPSAQPAVAAIAASASGHQQQLLVLYDGVCRLCSGLVAFLIARDPKATAFRFCAIQSSTGGALLSAAGISQADALRSFTVIELSSGQVHRYSDGALQLATRLSLPWRLAAATARTLVPSLLRDAVYSLVASNRYAWFGKDEERCLPATKAVLARFLDAEEVVADMKSSTAAAKAAKAASAAAKAEARAQIAAATAATTAAAPTSSPSSTKRRASSKGKQE